MLSLSISLLGGFHVELNGEPITAFESNKVRALLVYLAVEADRPHPRSTLAALLWPDHPESMARTNLRHVLRQLRQTLPGSSGTLPGTLGTAHPSQPFLLTSRRTIQINPQSQYALDVARFSEILACCQQCAHTALETCPDCVERYTQAAELYRGDFLAGFYLQDSEPFEEWTLIRREQYHRQALEIFFHLASSYERSGDHETARHYAWRQIEVEPWREEAHRQLMRILAHSGQRSAALAQYEQCRQVLADELGVEPSAETIALYQQIRTGNGDGLSSPISTGPSPILPSPAHPYTPLQDWGEAPTTAYFYGRQAEMAQLQQWLHVEHCRLVVVLGMGGMGKTTLVAKSANDLAGHFEFIFWRSLLNAAPLSDLLRQCLQFLSRQQLTELPDSFDEQLMLLLNYLRQHRCLLVFDNLESILEAGQAGQYRPGYEDYGQLIGYIGKSQHQSCLVLTSRERPQEIERLVEDSDRVRTLQLEGLEHQAVQALLKTRGLGDGADLTATLAARYSGNPLALKLVARTIQDLFAGDIAAFLNDEIPIFDDIRMVLDQQFTRLSPLEREILIWLAIERSGVSLPGLAESLVHAPSRRVLLEALRALQRRSLLEKTESGFTLQNVVTEFITDYVVEQVAGEIERGQIDLLNRHALLRAQAQEHVRQSQIRLILTPLAQRSEATLGRDRLAEHLHRLLDVLHTDVSLAPGYAGGNVLNLLLHLGFDASEYDFSNLYVWQAYLRGMYAPRLNFTGADLTGSVFTHIYGHIQGLQFRADDELLVVGTRDGMARVWRATNSELLHAVPTHDPIYNFVYLSTDSRIAALGGADHSIIIVDITDGRVQHTLSGHHSPLWRLIFSPDGKWMASGEASGQVCVWEVESGRLLHSLRGHSEPITALAFAPGHGAPPGLLASAAVDGSVCLWRPTTGQMIQTFQGHAEEVSVLQFALDGALLATGSHDSTVRLWDVASGALVHVLRGHTQPVRLMAADSTGRILATGGGDKFITLWDVRTAQALHILADHAASIFQLAFRADGQRVAALDANETVGVWDVHTGQRVDFYRIHHGAIQAVAFNPVDRQFVSGGADRAVYVWDANTPAGAHITARLQGHTQCIKSIAFSPDGETVASGDMGGEIRLWNIHSRASRVLRGRRGEIRALAFSPDGRKLACASTNGTIYLWNVDSGLQTLALRGHTNVATTCAFSPDGRGIVSGSMDRTIRLWDAETGELLHTMRRHTNMIQQVRYCLDGQRMISSSYDETLCLWDAHTGQLLASWPTQGTVYLSLAFHPNGEIMAAGGNDHILRMVEINTGRVISELHGHRRTVEAVSFSPDGQILVSAGHDETIKLWTIASTHEALDIDACQATLHAPGPYAGMNITGVTGITDAQKTALKSLGAVESPKPWATWHRPEPRPTQLTPQNR